MATNFRVEPRRLNDSSARITDLTGQYVSEYGKLYATIQDLTVQWKGQSSEVFNSRIEGYRDDFEQLRKLLEDYARVLKEIAQKYTETDAKMADMANKLSIGK